MEVPAKRPEKIKLNEINSYLTCYLCKGYLIDATTISECLHSFCRSCIIKFLQENSYCPVCEVIINKAKPNLKLDKTLQDIVYKLVPELFLKEMTRRKRFYQQYPEIAAKVAPEERGEDTERTIFNPQDTISLSMAYVSDDSAPGAIRIPEVTNVLEKGRNGCTTEESQESIMKRYLKCPAMCRIEVLKKFVRNKYNVDTNQFHIDILYKRVPLPDHYTLIDIAYIYSWKRNEPMKFFFRITDVNKLSSRFDFFDITKANLLDIIPKLPTRSRNNGERVANATRKRDSAAYKKIKKVCKEPSQNLVKVCDKNIENDRCESRVTEIKSELQINTQIESNSEIKNTCDNNDNKKQEVNKCSRPHKNNETELQVKVNHETIKTDKDQTNKTGKSEASADIPEIKPVIARLDVKEPNKDKPQSEKTNKSYTNITLNRSNNVEIITKIQPVSNKDGQPIGHHIIKQTIKKANKNACSASQVKKVTSKIDKTLPNTDKPVQNTNDTSNEEKADVYKFVDENSMTKPDEVRVSVQASIDDEKSNFLKSIELTAKSKVQSVQKKDITNTNNVMPTKLPELPQCLVTSKTTPDLKATSANGQKRKNSSPQKNDKPPKKPKVEKKSVVKIIIREKPVANTTAIQTQKNNADQKRDSDLQSLIDSCKINIPSSLSITIKESNENSRQPNQIPPVKNYIEILKLPDENSSGDDKTKLIIDGNDLKETLNPETIGKFCDNDSEQKVDQDLSEIAKSLTEKIPLSTTVSHIIGPKQQFPIPVKTNAPSKFSIQPSPVPELPCKLLNVPKDSLGKLTPRSPQTFQKIFEESIKKPDGQKGALDLTSEQAQPSNILQNNSKRNILEIASQLYKKTKMEQDKITDPNPEETTVSLPKVPIPRLPNQRTLQQPQKKSKFEPDSVKFTQTMANLHSSSLGMNYTVSVGGSGPSSPTKTTKVNGIVSPVKAETNLENKPQASELKVPASEFRIPSQSVVGSPPKHIETPTLSPKPNSIPRNLSPISCNNSPKHSPKSSPLIKHMYSPTPSYSQKIPSPLNRFSNLSPKLPTQPPKILNPVPKLPTASSLSPRTSPTKSSSPKATSYSATPTQAPNASPLSPNEILEKYNIQNLAQLTASFGLNPNFALNPSNQLAAIQQAMLLKHIEMQNRQNWLNMNQGPLLQYEKFLQNVSGKQSHLLGNIKEN